MAASEKFHLEVSGWVGMGACDMTCVGGAHCVPWNMKHVSTCNMRSGVMITSRGRENSRPVKTQAKAFWILALTTKPLGPWQRSSPPHQEKWREEEWGRSGDFE